MELALDTSSKTNNIALAHEGKVLSSFMWSSSHNETVELIPNLVHLLKQTRVELDLLKSIYIAIGPGSFNSLRVGLSIAKGLAFSLNIPLVSIGTLETMAYPFAYTNLPIIPIQLSGRDRIATAIYQQDNNWHCIKPEYLSTLELVCRQVKQQTYFCGEINPDMRNFIQQKLGSYAIIPPIPDISHIDALALLGWNKLLNGNQDNLYTLQPLYLRPPHITKPRKSSYLTNQNKDCNMNQPEISLSTSVEKSIIPTSEEKGG
jgi:tRNA threonylcarbamoyl adenosine modification protein YeaZ